MSKPSIEDLMNQIEDWKSQTKKEIELYDRKLEAQKRAADIFEH